MIEEYKYSAGNYSFSILNYGGAVVSLCVPDKNGNIINLIPNYPNRTMYEDSYLSLIIGRFANRISNANFLLNGKKYSFEANEKNTLLHSGKGSIAHRLWTVNENSDGFTCSVKTTQQEDGFPGNATFFVRYSLTKEGVFTIHYKVFVSEPCPINPTHHIAFNLNGAESKTDILSHILKINADYIAQLGENKIPTGKLIRVKNTAFDFTKEKEIGKNLTAVFDVYDHSYIIKRENADSLYNRQSRGFTHFATVFSEKTGIKMYSYTDMSAVHFFTGFNINGTQALCLETSFLPDCVNKPQFLPCILNPDEVFESSTVFCFSVENVLGNN